MKRFGPKRRPMIPDWLALSGPIVVPDAAMLPVEIHKEWIIRLFL